MRQFIMIYSILLGIVILFTISCVDKENCHDSINVVNNSNQSIYFTISFIYPDTVLNSDPTSDISFRIQKLSYKVDKYRRCLEGDFNYTSKIMCFIYDANTLETTPWDTVAKKYLVLKRYDLSLADLERMNWTITYP